MYRYSIKEACNWCEKESNHVHTTDTAFVLSVTGATVAVLQQFSSDNLHKSQLDGPSVGFLLQTLELN